MEEIWKDIKGYEGKYKVSSFGNIFSLKSNRLLSPHTNKRGYVYIVFGDNGKEKGFRVHRLVAEAFIPNPENKPHVNHIDHVKNNNNVNNLEWCTVKENIQASVLAGKNGHKGEKNATAILSDQTVREICILLQQGERDVDVAKKYSVNKIYVNSIRHGRKWLHISKDFNFPPAKTKLNQEDVLWIIEQLQKGIYPRIIANMSTKDYITLDDVADIKKRKTYKYWTKDFTW